MTIPPPDDNGLTPFPDGVGYMENAWRSLTSAQRRALFADICPHLHHPATLGVLRKFGLLNGEGYRTPRGQALFDWVTRNGLYR